MPNFKFLYSTFLILSVVGTFAMAKEEAFTKTAHEIVSATNRSAGAGIAQFKVGTVDVIALSDGTIPLNLHEILRGVSSDEIDALMEHSFQRSPAETSINAFLVKTGNRLILVDTGAGELFGSVGGRLPQSLAVAGYRPEDITDILLTHIHTDHSGGLALAGEIVFPNATVHVGKGDVDFFLNPNNVGKGLIPRYLEEAQNTVGLYLAKGKLKAFSGNTELFPGITAIQTPGHTPGHSFYRVESEGETIEFWGDIVHIGPVQIPKPKITITFDVDQDAARVQRKKQFAIGARERKLIAAPHLNFPGVGYLRKAETGYDWVPAAYRNRD